MRAKKSKGLRSLFFKVVVLQQLHRNFPFFSFSLSLLYPLSLSSYFTFAEITVFCHSQC